VPLACWGRVGREGEGKGEGGRGKGEEGWYLREGGASRARLR